MQGDITRSTFKRTKHYDSVRMQQGRVQMDADWNEQMDIQAYRARTTDADIIGAQGSPRYDSGFAVDLRGGDLWLTKGRMYVDGILCENEADVRLAAQEDAPNVTLPTDLGLYLAYLDVWQRGVTALDDPEIREVALGGPDTATRTRVVWQAHFLRVGEEGATGDCRTAFPAWGDLTGAVSGQMTARVSPETPTDNPCLIPAGAGYRRTENQLYRVEVHGGGATGTATFKWSRDNGSIVAAWTGQDVNDLTVSSLGRDAVLGFAPNEWVELTDDTHELAGQPGTLVKIVKAEGLTVTIDPSTASGSVDLADFPRNARIRRWDMDPGSAGAAVTQDTFAPLEDGVEVAFQTGGTYRTGDYWLIPARTITGDIEWPRLFGLGSNAPKYLPQPPNGTEHHFARLAVLRRRDTGWELVDDCRQLFPPLTHICADDICYNNDACNLPNVVTVQDALDRLCGENDLRFHNKHLHGWGIVCGLEVVCGPDEREGKRRNVTVRTGYAIDCQGNDLRFDQDAPLDIMSMIGDLTQRNPNAPVLDPKGNGEVCLLLAPAGSEGSPFQIERFDPAQDPWDAIFRALRTGNLKGITLAQWQSALGGTLFMDFYNECLMTIQKFLQAQLHPSGDDKSLAGPGHQRVSALTNVLAQTVNPKVGQNIFVSAREDAILRQFYNDLRAVLQSETFCAMFDNARPFPAQYPFANLGMDTIFSRGQHTRLHLRPGATELYSLGAGLNPTRPSTIINRFDLKQNILVAQIDPIAGTSTTQPAGDTGTGALQDIAFSPNGQRIYIAASTKNDDNTLFRSGTFDRQGNITWGPVVTICGVKLVTLATTAADPNNVYAIGLKKQTVQSGNTTRTELRGAGLYRINPDNVDPNMAPVAAFNAVGHLEIAADGRAVATAAAENTSIASYTRLLRFQLPAATAPPEIGLPSAGQDDIAILAKGEGARREAIYVVLGTGARSLMAYDLGSAQPILQQPITLENTAIRLEPFPATQVLLMTSEDGYYLRGFSMVDNVLLPDYVLPVQVGPIAITSDRAAGRAYILNYASNTITVAPRDVLAPGFRFDFAALAEYRKAIVEAYVDLLAGFLQYLKDCLCEHFLVRCPPTECNEKIYLGCVSIRGEQVYKVCNFSKRKYVKSFPTVGYWLSLVPIMPFLDQIVEVFCCSVLPDLLGRYTVPAFDPQAPHEPSARLKGATLRQGFNVVQNANLRGALGQIVGRVGTARSVAGDALTQPKRNFVVPSRSTHADFVNQPTDQVEERLKAEGVSVERQPYDPATQPNLAANLVGLFREPTAGRHVTLYEEDGQVRYYSVTEPDPSTRALSAEVGNLSEAVTSRATEVVQLRSEMDAQKASVAETLAQREAEVADLKGQLDAQKASLAETLAARDTELTQLRSQLQTHEATLAEVATLKSSLSDAQAALTQREQEMGALRSQVDTLQQRQQQLDPQRVADLETQLRDMRSFRDEVTRFMQRPR